MIIALAIGWALCVVLTVADVFSRSPDGYGYALRTDRHSAVFREAAWFTIPYPCASPVLS